MKPADLKELPEIADMSPHQIYEVIADTARKCNSEIAVRQSKPTEELTYGQLMEDADFMSRNIPFENHPVEIDLDPGIGVVVAIVASLKRGCQPVSNDRVSKVKLIINDNTVRISGSPPKHNPLIRYVVKSMEAVHQGRREIIIDNRRQLRRQDFIDSLIRMLMAGGLIKIKN